MKIVVLLFVLVASTFAARRFQCSFYVPSTNASGTFNYDWDRARMTTTFSWPQLESTEYYWFNSNRGYGSYFDQFRYRRSFYCTTCSTTALNNIQPHLDNNRTFLTPSRGSFIPVNMTGSMINQVDFDANGYPSSIIWRLSGAQTLEVRYSNCVPNTAAGVFNKPSDCECGQPLDVVMMVDRSSSISRAHFNEMKSFIVSFTNALTYGPNAVNLGLINFHSQTWRGPVELRAGTSSNPVQVGVNALSCWNTSRTAAQNQCRLYNFSPGPADCCGIGTCLSCGMIVGADMLSTQSSRGARAGKVLIMLTDGAESTWARYNTAAPIYDAGTTDMTGTSTNDPNALSWSTGYARSKNAGVEIYAVGVGQFNRQQLQVITANPQDSRDVAYANARILTTGEFSNLNTLVRSLVLLTCQQRKNDTTCTDCCGNCRCSDACRDYVTTGRYPCANSSIVGCSPQCVAEAGFDCSSGTCRNRCGDGRVVIGEACDDGNTRAGDGCSPTCTIENGFLCPSPGLPCLARCGDGVRVATEACDDGNTKSGDGCSTTCTIEDGWRCTRANTSCTEICGDSRIVGNEKCDDGNSFSLDGCSASCQLEFGWLCPTPGVVCITDCKDLKIAGSERCDDGNTRSGDGCSSNCLRETGWICPNVNGIGGPCTTNCSDGLVVGNEKCDDGNRRSGDGCGSDCLLIEVGFQCTTPGSPCQAICGNSILNGTEQCDDGNTQSSDGCSATCQREPGFTCPLVGACRGICGDGLTVAGEQCDDNNTRNGDGCNSRCQLEPGWRCTGRFCVPVCGDKILMGGEQCDDGNTASGDGCSSSCRRERGYVCNPVGVPCTAVCGDGYRVVAREQCDDNNTRNGDGCSSNCTIEPGFTCPRSPCIPTCGDRLVKGNETCDDGNRLNGDGCSSVCQLEKGYKLVDGQYRTECGDGVVGGTEQCDDGNTANDDGCSDKCAVESFYTCPDGGVCCNSLPEHIRGLQCFNGWWVPPQGREIYVSNPSGETLRIETNISVCGDVVINGTVEIASGAWIYISGTTRVSESGKVVLEGVDGTFPPIIQQEECGWLPHLKRQVGEEVLIFEKGSEIRLTNINWPDGTTQISPIITVAGCVSYEGSFYMQATNIPSLEFDLIKFYCNTSESYKGIYEDKPFSSISSDLPGCSGFDYYTVLDPQGDSIVISVNAKGLCTGQIVGLAVGIPVGIALLGAVIVIALGGKGGGDADYYAL